MERRHLEQHYLILQDLNRANSADPTRALNARTTGEAARKAALPPPSSVNLNQPINFAEPERSTPKTSQHESFFMERGKPEGGRLPASAFMQPSPGGHREGIPHIFPPDISLTGLPPGAPFGLRLPMDSILFPHRQQPPPPHLLHLSQQMSARFPMDLENKDLELRSPSPLLRQHGRMHNMATARDTLGGILQVRRYLIYVLNNSTSF